MMASTCDRVARKTNCDAVTCESIHSVFRSLPRHQRALRHSTASFHDHPLFQANSLFSFPMATFSVKRQCRVLIATNGLPIKCCTSRFFVFSCDKESLAATFVNIQPCCLRRDASRSVLAGFRFGRRLRPDDVTHPLHSRS